MNNLENRKQETGKTEIQGKKVCLFTKLGVYIHLLPIVIELLETVDKAEKNKHTKLWLMLYETIITSEKRTKEVCEEVLIEEEICTINKETNETECTPAKYETQCHNETEYYLESVEVRTEYYDSEKYIGLMADEIDESFVKTTDRTSRINLYGLISKIWVLLGGHDEKIINLETENQLLKTELCKRDATYPWCK